MKYLICLAALGFGVLTQSQFHPLPTIEIDDSTIQIKQEDLQILNDMKPLHQLQNREYIKEGQFLILDQNQDQKVKKEYQREQRPNQKHYKKGHDKMKHFDHNQTPKPNEPRKSGHHKQEEGRLRIEEDQAFKDMNDEQEKEDHTPHRKFWKKKALGHILFWVVLTILSLFMIRTCVRKRNRQNRRRQTETQNLNNPAQIDEEIRKHYESIQRLTQIKNSVQIQAQTESHPIIYHQVYPEEMEMRMNGRMINENSYPRNIPRNQHFQNIPVGRPVVNNPYSHPQIFRGNQY